VDFVDEGGWAAVDLRLAMGEEDKRDRETIRKREFH
jgi:hypothetical protein